MLLRLLLLLLLWKKQEGKLERESEEKARVRLCVKGATNCNLSLQTTFPSGKD